MDSTVPKDLHAADLHVSVYENTKYNRYAQLELDSAEVRDGHLVVKGTAGLFTRNFSRSLLVGMRMENSAVFALRLPGSPKAADTGDGAGASGTPFTRRVQGSRNRVNSSH